MAEFDFSTLNSSDFEVFVWDLLNANERTVGTPVVYRTYKEGRDRGIDLLYSTEANDYDIVGQVKHYYRSGIAALLSHLEKSEAPKVKKLNPNRYIVATSLELSAENTQEIRNIFKPYIKNLTDVHDKNSLNELLGRFPEVVRSHYKLWFSGTEVLRTLLQYEVEGRSNEFQENELKKRIRLYVETPAIHAARSVLDKNNFVIITGEPGVGKTTTAELLLYQMIAEGYDLVYLYDDIKESEAILNDKNRKAIFYFDDFLGHNAVEIEKAKGSETALLKILRRISTSDNKKFIFTTRTFIFNHAIEESERLRQINIKAKQSLIPLTLYDEDLKLKLLNNHIEESVISDLHKQVLKRPDIQNFIINHHYFSPRSVAFITSSSTLSEISPDSFANYIKENFNQPDRIWRHAYEKQIDDLARIMLNTMVSFGNAVDLSDMEKAFNNRIDYEVRNNNFQKPLYAFRIAFRRIENGFIVADSHFKGRYLFINPSLVDFLINSIKKDKDEVFRIAEAAAFVQQLITRLYNLNDVRPNLPMSEYLKEKIINHYGEFIYPETRECDIVKLALLSHHYLNNMPLTLRLINEVADWADVQSDRETSALFWKFLELVDEPALMALFREKANEIFVPIIMDTYALDDLIATFELATSKFLFNIADSLEILDELNQMVSSMLNEKIENDVDDLKSYSNAQNFVGEKEEESELLRERLETFGLTIKANFSEYNAYDWWEIGTQNYNDEQMAKDD